MTHCRIRSLLRSPIHPASTHLLLFFFVLFFVCYLTVGAREGWRGVRPARQAPARGGPRSTAAHHPPCRPPASARRGPAAAARSPNTTNNNNNNYNVAQRDGHIRASCRANGERPAVRGHVRASLALRHGRGTHHDDGVRARSGCAPENPANGKKIFELFRIFSMIETGPESQIDLWSFIGPP